MRRLAPSARIFVLVFVAAATGCSPASTVCAPGASVACTGPGGCSGGQVCNAAGSGFEACLCSTGDSGIPADSGVGADTGSAADTGSTAPDAWAAPTMGAIRVHWMLMRGSSTLACSDVTGLDHISVLSTSASGGFEDVFACADGMGTTADRAFGTYDVVVNAVDGAGASLGSSASRPVTLAASPCDAQVGTTCVQDVTVVVTVF